MTPWGTLVIIGAYLLGLLATGTTEVRLMGQVSVIGIWILVLGIACSAFVPRVWRMGPTRRQWWIAGLVGMLAASYCIARAPLASQNDVSLFASRQKVHVIGNVLEVPQTSRSNKGRFFFQAQSVRGMGNRSSIEAPRTVSGKLYVTAPLSPSKRLYPGELVELQGEIYTIEKGKGKAQAGFGEYLARKGCFAGLRANWIEFLPDQKPPKWALWKLRRRIVTAQDRWLGEPAGNLLSAMTLGRKAVDLPYGVRDSFIDAGLAHTLAASGFHVSLILALVMGVLRTQLPKTKAIAGGSVLILYIGLTGLQPSVVRAALMGTGALLGLAMGRKVSPLGGLLVAATAILLVNPQWIWDVGFQLSVVATLGLVLTVPRLMRFLDWMPTTVATLFAVPIAAYLWTIPLQLLYFQRLPLYSILLNGLATPLVIVISLGGFISAIAAVIWPIFGSAIATNLYYPIHGLIWLVEQFNRLPGSSLEFTGVQGWHVVLSYCMYAGVCLWLWQKGNDGLEMETAIYGM
ncbi:MAG: ComEC/Rec2 family competence protein [Cyanobacteria bacterium J06634_6]